MPEPDTRKTRLIRAAKQARSFLARISRIDTNFQARQGWHICRKLKSENPKLRRSGIIGEWLEYTAPMELNLFWGCGSTKMSRLTALVAAPAGPARKRSGFSCRNQTPAKTARN
jgi:hypothetical protein